MPIARCRFGFYVAVVLIFSRWAAGQQSVHSAGQHPTGQQSGHPAGQQSAGSDAVFQPYTTCKFSDGLAVVETTPLALGVTTRTVETTKGPKDVQMIAGRRVLFSYSNKDFFANVKVEVLPEKNYAEEKQSLIDNFDFLLASGKDSSRNYALRPTMHGLGIRGLDRQTLEQPVIGFYLLFDDLSHVATTIYLLNQEPSVRSFQTIEEYAAMRDRFLDAYTACIRVKTSGQ
jgi:hypothetical protein